MKVLGSLWASFLVTFECPEESKGSIFEDFVSSGAPFWKPGRVERIDFEGLGLTLGFIFGDF